MALVAVQLRPLMILHRIFHGQRVQPEFSAQDGEILPVRFAQVQPDHARLIDEVVTNVGDRKSLEFQHPVPVEPGPRLAFGRRRLGDSRLGHRVAILAPERGRTGGVLLHDRAAARLASGTGLIRRIPANYGTRADGCALIRPGHSGLLALARLLRFSHDPRAQSHSPLHRALHDVASGHNTGGSGETIVPAVRSSSAAASPRRPMAAMPPVASTKRQTASTFGPIDPAGKVRARSSLLVTARSGRACGVPYPSWTASTSVSSSRASASTACASRAAVRSLSTTHSTPRSRPEPSSVTGMPPPPAQTTIAPRPASSRISGSSISSRGSGDGTTRRHAVPSWRTSQPPWAASWRACSSG